MTRFYISAQFGRQEEARQVADQVTRATGWECTASWLTVNPAEDEAAHTDPTVMRDAAWNDLSDIGRADVMFCLTEDLTPHKSYSRDFTGPPVHRLVRADVARGGRHVEVGYAITRIPVIIIGPRENVFHGLCREAATVDEAIALALQVTGGGQ